MARKNNIEWRRLAQAWERSGKRQKTFCEEQGISLWGLRNWQKKQARPKSTANAAETAYDFVEVTSAKSRKLQQQTTLGICRIVVRDYCIEVTDGVMPETVITVLQAVEVACGPSLKK